MWLPEQVAEIMRANDWDEGFEAGKQEGFDKGRESVRKEMEEAKWAIHREQMQR